MPFDIVVGGRERGPDEDQERAYIQALGEAGVTWYSEFIEPKKVDLDAARAFIKRGPLRID
jgi:hypothetical protein